MFSGSLNIKYSQYAVKIELNQSRKYPERYIAQFTCLNISNCAGRNATAKPTNNIDDEMLNVKFHANAAQICIFLLDDSVLNLAFHPRRLMYKSDLIKVYIPLRTTPVATTDDSKNESPCLKANHVIIIKIFRYTPRNIASGDLIIVFA